MATVARHAGGSKVLSAVYAAWQGTLVSIEDRVDDREAGTQVGWDQLRP